MASYVRSSARTVQTAVKDAVPIEFELRRARDLAEQIIPEMQANIRLIAQEEVEIAALKSDIGQSQQNLTDEKKRIEKVSTMLGTQQVSYLVSDQQYTRQDLKEYLAQRFDQFKEVEVILAGKQRLLSTRERALQAAMHMLDQSRSQKTLLEQKIETLESQYRLVQASSVGSHIQVDNSKLAQTEKLIGDIKKHLDVAERVLAHEARFVQPIPIDTISEKDLLTEISDHFAANPTGETAAANGDKQPEVRLADRH
jgi:hypothetical protein